MSSLPKLQTDIEVISKLGRVPNKDNELTWKELQEKFETPGVTIKEYLNNTLIPAIETLIAAIDPSLGDINGSKILTNTLPSNRIQNSSITDAQIADNAITSAKIALGAITSIVLAANAVTSDKIANNAVTEGKVNASAITTAKLADDAVTAEKIDDTSAIVTVNGKVGNPYITKMKTGTSTAFTEESPATLTDYPYKASITDADVTADDKVYVEFNATQINSGIYAPMTQSYSGGFYLYCSESHTAETINYTIMKA